MYRISDFFYTLPPELIARYPTPVRSESRLLYLSKTGKINHTHFYDIVNYLETQDLLVLNNTKVLPARLYGEKASGGKIEILVEKILDTHRAQVHCRASKRPKIGQHLHFEEDISAIVLADESHLLELQFEDSRSVVDILLSYGHIPLPPYLNRTDEAIDRERYQTVYAKKSGSVAAPTAGLHFDEKLLRSIKASIAYVTLHVGAGTFQPLRNDHIMHSEYAEVSEEVCQKIRHTQSRGGRIIAVGTTTTRTLETASLSGKIKPFQGETQLFIKPGFAFQCVDAMITNFHLPESTLLMLVCAFGGYENVMQAYQEAITEKYRFFSYGDAMFVEKNT